MEFKNTSQAKKQTALSYLGGIATSAKIDHSRKYSHQYTYGLYLSPAKCSGYNTCSHSTPECRMGCLNTSGRAGIEIFTGTTMIQDARIKKTKLFFEHTAFFMEWLIADILSARAKAERDGYFFSVRLNCTSDIDWQNVFVEGKNIFSIFPDVAFYDYTKNANKFNNLPANYHLTYSYTGRNAELCEVLLKKGYNVAMVFNVKSESDLPKYVGQYQVINGDLTDYRIDDAKGIIVGLKWKRIGNRKAEKIVLNSCFVVKPDEVGNPLELVNAKDLVEY